MIYPSVYWYFGDNLSDVRATIMATNPSLFKKPTLDDVFVVAYDVSDGLFFDVPVGVDNCTDTFMEFVVEMCKDQMIWINLRRSSNKRVKCKVTSPDCIVIMSYFHPFYISEHADFRKCIKSVWHVTDEDEAENVYYNSELTGVIDDKKY